MDKRSPGFYWVLYCPDVNEEWTIAEWVASSTGYWWAMLGDDMVFDDDDLLEIGERIPNHV